MLERSTETTVGVEWPLDLFRRSSRVATARQAVEATDLSIQDRERLLAAAVREQAREKPLEKVQVGDEFPGMSVVEVRETPGQDGPTPQQHRSGPHPSTRNLKDPEPAVASVEEPPTSRNVS